MPIIKNAKHFWQLLKETWKEFSKADTFTLGGAVAYYTIFSMAPVMIIMMAVASAILGRQAVEGRIYGTLADMIGPDAALRIQEMISDAYDPGNTWWRTAIALGLLIFGATFVFIKLQESLNFIWEVKAKPKKGYLKFIKDRALSFGIVLAIGFVLLVSLLLTAALSALTDVLKQYLPDYSIVLFRALDIAVGLGIVALLFALIYKFLPDARVRWRDVWIGALFTSVLFALGRMAIGFYLRQSDAGSAYGAAGGLVLVLMWVNYSSQILFFGAEFTKVYARQFGSRIQPREYAVRTRLVEVEQKDEETVDKFEHKAEKIEEICETGLPEEPFEERGQPDVSPGSSA